MFDTTLQNALAMASASPRPPAVPDFIGTLPDGTLVVGHYKLAPYPDGHKQTDAYREGLGLSTITELDLAQTLAFKQAESLGYRLP